MKSIIKVGILMSLAILLAFTFVSVLKVFGISSGPVTKVIPFVSMLIAAMAFLKLIDKRTLSDIGLMPFQSSLDYSGILFVMALMPFVISLISSKDMQLTKPINISVIVTASYCFLIGFSEELLFRGYIYNTVSIRKLKVVISALAFAGFHFISPEFNAILFVLYFIFGVIKAYLFKMIRNLWPLILFHMIWDLGTQYTDYYSNVIIDLACLAMAVIVVTLVVKMRNKSEGRELIAKNEEG